MKYLHCHIYQFGKLKEKEFSFSDGITLISGKNESGKTTLHTAMAALLFGAEKGRGRAAAGSVHKLNRPWHEPELYGGSLDYEQAGSLVHIERDLAATPPRARITETKDGAMREISGSSMPLPEPLSPYLFYNTLSFKQMGGAVEAGMADELRSHIINLESSGSENLNVAAALSQLKEKRRLLQKQLDPELPGQAAAVQTALSDLAAEDLSADTEEDEKGAVLALLKERGLADQAVLDKDLKNLDNLCKQLELYEESYAPGMTSPLLNRFVSLLTIPFMLIFFWLTINYLQAGNYFSAALAGAGLAASLFFSTRFSRRQDARDAQKHNLEVLNRMYAKYYPDHKPEGKLSEAMQLGRYVERLRDILAESGDSEAGREALERQITARLRREQWEAEAARLMDEKEALAARLEENDRIKKEIDAVNLAGETISSLARELYSSFGSPLTEAASGIFSEITGGSYEGVRVSDQLEVFALQNHREIPPAALSGGTMEQLYFSFRIAMIRLLWPNEKMPLFFDDSFAFYDRERLEALLLWLHQHYQGQVFIFTCQDREEELLNQLSVPYQKISL